MIMEKTKIKERLIEFRIQKGMTQSEFSGLSGIPIVTISRIENGQNLPSAKTIHKIEKVINEMV